MMGRSGYEQVTGKTPNISELLDFEFYDLVWWWDRPNKQILLTLDRLYQRLLWNM
jgi:hypothetical protein